MSIWETLRKIFNPSEDEVLVSRVTKNLKNLNTSSVFLITSLCKAYSTSGLNIECREFSHTRNMVMGYYNISYTHENLQIIIERNAPNQYDEKNSMKIMVYNSSLNGVEDFTEYYTEDLQKIIIMIIERTAQSQNEKIKKSKQEFLQYN